MNKKLGAKDRIMITFRPELFQKFVLEEPYYKIVLSVLKFIMIFFPYFGMPYLLSTLSGLLSYLNLVIFSYVFLMPVFTT